jgi:CRP-like cAMP-binding protein
MNQNSLAVRESAQTWQHQRSSAPLARPKAADSIATLMRCRRGQMIYQEGAQVESWYRLVSGTARRFILRPDGRRQIIDLLLSGDVFGFGARGYHAFTAEAISDGTVVARYPRIRLENLARSDPRLARELLEMSLQEAHRLQDLVLILGRTTAQHKVGAFLLHLAERLVGRGTDRVTLPISRYDIADYLALSVETVSRALTALKQSGCIVFSGPRQVRIVDRGAIESTDSLGPFNPGAKLDAFAFADQRSFR